MPCNEREGFFALRCFELVGCFFTVRIIDYALIFEKINGISMAFNTFVTKQKQVLFGGFKTEKTRDWNTSRETPEPLSCEQSHTNHHVYLDSAFHLKIVQDLPGQYQNDPPTNSIRNS